MHRPVGLVHREFKAGPPNRLCVTDLTCVATSRGFVLMALVIDVFSRRIAGRCASTLLRTALALNALEALQLEHALGHVHPTVDLMQRLQRNRPDPAIVY